MANKGSTPKTMKALVAYAKDDYRFEAEYPAPTCGPDDIIIKTEACGVCAGDLKCSHGAAMFWGDDVQPSWVKPPFIPGHENRRFSQSRMAVPNMRQTEGASPMKMWLLFLAQGLLDLE